MAKKKVEGIGALARRRKQVELDAAKAETKPESDPLVRANYSLRRSTVTALESLANENEISKQELLRHIVGRGLAQIRSGEYRLPIRAVIVHTLE